MNKKLLLTGIILPLMMGVSAEQKNMKIWLNNGENYIYPIEEVDSITFSEQVRPAYSLSDENTMPPTLNSPQPLSLTEEQISFVKGNNEFGKKCLDYIAKGSTKNYCFSPVSLNIALGMCANTADPTGVKELADAMGFKTKNPLADMNSYYNELCQSLNSPIDKVIVTISNALWLDKGMKELTKQEFVETLRNQYFSTIRTLDFINDPNGSKDTINHWADLMTKGRIKEISADITDSTKAVINNATYFKGEWVPEFFSLADQKFYLSDSSSKEVPIIYTGAPMEYYKTDDYEAVNVFFGIPQKKGDTYSMIFLMPDEGKSLKEVLPDVQWENIPFTQQFGYLTMPEFEFNANYDLTKTLTDLGIKRIFFTCSEGFYRDDIFVNQVTQDTYIKVDKKGAEAAAVTTIVMGSGNAARPTFDMKINRPYAFAIRENKTGLLLFVGIVNDPTYHGNK